MRQAVTGGRRHGGSSGSSARRAGRDGHHAVSSSQPTPIPEDSLGTSLLRLGALGRNGPGEDLVLELSSDVEGGLREGPTAHGSDNWEPGFDEADGAEGHPHRPIVEHDLRVQEYFSDDDAWAASSGSAAGGLARAGARLLAWAPGATAGRRLMEARSRRCVICLAEKEHTLVPPHRNVGALAAAEKPAAPGRRLLWGSASGSAASTAATAPQPGSQRVEDHRFCTDCWQNYLQHLMRQGSGTPAGPRELLCPVCRVPIDVPDVYTVRMELPDAWQSQCEPPPSAPLPLPAVSLQQAPHGRGYCWWRSTPESALWAWRRVGACLATSGSARDVSVGLSDPLGEPASLEEQRDPILTSSDALQAGWLARTCGGMKCCRSTPCCRAGSRRSGIFIRRAVVLGLIVCAVALGAVWFAEAIVEGPPRVTS